MGRFTAGGGSGKRERMKTSAVLVLAAVVLTPFAMISFGLLMKMGIETSLHRYGASATIGMIALIVPLLVVLGFLFDKRQGPR